MRPTAPLLAAFLPALASLLAFPACEGKREAQSPSGVSAASATAAPTSPPPTPACVDAPADPATAIAREPGVLNACLAGAKPDPITNVCGGAKIALTVGRDGRVTSAQVSQSSLPPGVTDCIRARLAAIQYACPASDTASYSIPVGFGPTTGTGACPGFPGGT